MGEAAVSGLGPRTPQVPITDREVCRSYLVGVCPHDVFTNTKQDFGPCPKLHNEVLKNEYEAADEAQKRKWGFEFDYLRDLEKHVLECNRRIDAAQRRLEKTPDEIRQTNALLREIADLTASINAGALEVDILGEESFVNIGVTELFTLKQARETKEARERELKALSDTSGPSGHQKLQVCDVCGAYLSRLDNDRRLADHFWGKMHLGYATMRENYEKLQKQLKGRAPPQQHHEGGYGGHRGSYDDGGYGDRGGYGRGGRRGGRGGYRGGRSGW
jgi:hypothetical protein